MDEKSYYETMIAECDEYLALSDSELFDYGLNRENLEYSKAMYERELSHLSVFI